MSNGPFLSGKTRVFSSLLGCVIHLACWACDAPPLAAGEGEVGLPWSSDQHPDDKPQHHVERITAAIHRYSVRQGGTMDGQNCRSPIGVFEAWEQSWESNRSVRMENIGKTNLVNPWLSNGRNHFRSAREIVQSAIEPGMSDREKAIAIWYQETQNRYHFSTWDQEDNNPVKVFNSYGYNTCGDDSMCLAGLWRTAGLRVRPARIMGHCVTQVFYEGDWHLMDGDMHSFYLLRDNHTIASERDLVRDHDLIKRSHTHGILAPDSHQTSEWEASLYVYEGDSEGTRDMIGDHSMKMVLRPNEALTWRWGHSDPVKYHGGSLSKYPDTICNGTWEYAPDLTGDIWRGGAVSVQQVQSTADGLAAEAGYVGTIVWKIQSPYVMVGGRIRIEGDHVDVTHSWDGKEWKTTNADLDAFFPPEGPARYEYYLCCRLADAARLRQIQIVTDLQMAPLGMPGMVVGDNSFEYSDQSESRRDVRITHEWVERSVSEPPAPPRRALHPQHASQIRGTDITFRWTPAVDADGDAIADYHFQLSDRADMKWPLSTNFDKLVSRTADRGRAQYRLPHIGLLNSGKTYYWRVRGQDAHGVWGQWSEIWNFVPRAPAYPQNVSIEVDCDRDVAILKWEPNPAGQPAACYRVYGSDEKGFTVHDTPFRRFVGNQTDETILTVPANFVAETCETKFIIAGRCLPQRNTNKAFYRVVAVDGDGSRSAASDFAAAPRPFIYSSPVLLAAVGADYRYTVSTIRSEGDLRCRIPHGELAMSFWDIEHPRFSLERGPDWLTIDPLTGLISGRPPELGEFEVVVSATIEREVPQLDETRLSWGQELVVGVETRHIGTARQRFKLSVQPQH